MEVCSSTSLNHEKRPLRVYRFRLVAEVGFEHNDLQVMGLTSYHCSTPRSVLVSPLWAFEQFNYLRFLRRAFSLFTFLLRDFFKKNSLLRASWMVPALLTCLLNLRRASSKVSFSRTVVFGMYFTSLKLSQRVYYCKVV